MEERGFINPKRRPPIEEFSEIMAQQLADLVRQLIEVEGEGLPRPSGISQSVDLQTHFPPFAINS